MTVQIGSPTLATLALLIPLVTAALLWGSTWLRRASYRRRFSGWRRAWEMWVSNALLTIALFGVFYWYLFWRPFYTVTTRPDGAWSLDYQMPARSVTLAASEVRRVSVEPDLLPLRQRRVVRIELNDGRTFTSALTGAREATDAAGRLGP